MEDKILWRIRAHTKLWRKHNNHQGQAHSKKETRSQQEGKQGNPHQRKTQIQKLTLKKKEEELSKGKHYVDEHFFIGENVHSNVKILTFTSSKIGFSD